MNDFDTLTHDLAADLDRAFPDLVRAVQDDLFAGALRMTGIRADAEDIVQEALIRAYRALQGYPAGQIRDLRLRGWVWTIALNLCRNRARSRSRKPAGPFPERFDPASGAAGPEDLAIEGAGAERLAARLAGLPWPQRHAVVLRHVVGLPYAEISAATGRPVGTVKADVHRGLARLRETVPREEHR